MTSIDRTVLTNKSLPESWKCPHCGKHQTFTPQDEEIFLKYGKFIRQCERCGYLHLWELHLTDDFKRKVADMVNKINNFNEPKGERKEE